MPRCGYGRQFVRYSERCWFRYMHSDLFVEQWLRGQYNGHCECSASAHNGHLYRMCWRLDHIFTSGKSLACVRSYYTIRRQLNRGRRSNWCRSRYRYHHIVKPGGLHAKGCTYGQCISKCHCRSAGSLRRRNYYTYFNAVWRYMGCYSAGHYVNTRRSRGQYIGYCDSKLYCGRLFYIRYRYHQLITGFYLRLTECVYRPV